MMKKIAVFLLLVSGIALAQTGARFDSQAIGAKGPLANVTITVCTSTAVGIPCSPAATTFTDGTFLTQCSAGLPVTLPGSSSCQTTSDSLGNYGFWLTTGQYRYSLSGPGITGKLYDLTIQSGISTPVSTANGGTGVSGSAVFPTSGTVVTEAGTEILTNKTYGGTTLNKQVFTSSGTFTIPANVTSVKVMIIGGGGAGGGSTATLNGSGGGAAPPAFKWLSGLTPGNTITVTVGAGGTGVSGATGNAGGSSSISSGTQTITTVTSSGGNGGTSSATLQAGGAGGSTTNADITMNGSPGAATSNTSLAGSGGNGPFGGGGQDNASGQGFGSGGGGSQIGATQAGPAGSGGIVIFEWTT